MPRITGISRSACAYMSSGSYTKCVVFHIRRRYSAATTPAVLWNRRERTRRLTNDIAGRPASTLRPPVRIRIEQPMQMHDEVAHMGVVDGLLGLRLPGGISGSVIRINADDIELVEVLEFDLLEIGELAAENQVQQLCGRGLIRHDSVLRAATEP